MLGSMADRTNSLVYKNKTTNKQNKLPFFGSWLFPHISGVAKKKKFSTGSEKKIMRFMGLVVGLGSPQRLFP